MYGGAKVGDLSNPLKIVSVALLVLMTSVSLAVQSILMELTCLPFTVADSDVYKGFTVSYEHNELTDASSVWFQSKDNTYFASCCMCMGLSSADSYQLAQIGNRNLVKPASDSLHLPPSNSSQRSQDFHYHALVGDGKC